MADAMIGQPQEISNRINDLTLRLGAEVMRSLQRYHELLQRVASGELDDATGREAYLRFMRDETERYLLGVAKVSVGYYDAFLELASMYNPPFFERALPRRQPTHAAEPRAHRGAIELRGALGDEAAGEFTIDGQGGRSEQVAFVVSEFSGPPGVAPFRPPLRLQPAQFLLGPSGSQVVSIRLPLVAGLFVPNQRYTATLTVQTRDAFDLTISVVAGAPSNRVE